MGVICCHGLVRVRSLAAEFWTLEPGQGFVGNPGHDSIAVVQTGCDEGLYKCFCHRVREGGAESGDVSEMVEGRFCYGFYMGLEREGGVQDDSQVADFGGRGDGAAVNGEKQVANLLELRLGSHNDELSFVAVYF